jgi:ribose-phosphate pyrophosphokinase
LDRAGYENTTLILPYLPNARADRVFTLGQPLAVKVTCDIINSFNFKEVSITDPHSDVGPALLNNCVVYHQAHLVTGWMDNDFTLVAPDIGAAKKVFFLAQRLNHREFVQGLKIRDIPTGEIIKCDIQRGVPIEGKNLLIADDICDGGDSFIYLAKKLKEEGAGKVGLYISHGIFSKGLGPLEGVIDHIICNNIVGEYVTYEDIKEFNSKV